MDNIFSYLEKDYKELYSLGKEIDENIFSSPHIVLTKGRVYGEKISKEIAKLENMCELFNLGFADRLRELRFSEIIDEEVSNYFYKIRTIGNQAAHEEIEDELLHALNIHKYIYKITSWFIETYIDFNFNAPTYKTPSPTVTKDESNILKRLLVKVDDIWNASKRRTNSEKIIIDNTLGEDDNKENYQDMVTDVNIAVDISEPDMKAEFSENDKECLVQALGKLKESSKEAVEGLNTFSDFKKYMHITRDVQNEFEELILKAYNKESSQLILVCGSVGDGKSHIISYFKNKYPNEMSKFTLHNDATESLEPKKTSMDTLNDILDNFSDDKIENSNEKFILAINLGTLNNFIDSEYGSRFTKLKKFVLNKKILEQSIEDNKFDENNNFQFINFSDYHLFTLKNGKVNSNYIRSLMNKIIEPSELNEFYNSYKDNCRNCNSRKGCPIKANYELLSKIEVQNSIIDLLVQCIIKNKIIISTRALLNFMYELLIARSYVDINSPMFKQNIAKLNKVDYIQALTPNIVFNHKELSFIFEGLNTLDPLNVRNSGVDRFIIEFNNSDKIIPYFNEYIDFPKGYLDKLDNFKIEDTEDKNIRSELLKLFIRSYYICGRGELLNLKDEIYEKYIMNLYYWNKGEKSKLKELYNEVKNGIVGWNGEAEKNHINIFLGQNQVKYKISSELDLKADISNLKSISDVELVKFLTKLRLNFKAEKESNGQEIDIDYNLYNLLNKVGKGYRPNKKDKNQFIKFIEYISKLEESGSQNERIVFTEKNKEKNKKYRLEYNDEFEEYRFVEM